MTPAPKIPPPALMLLKQREERRESFCSSKANSLFFWTTDSFVVPLLFLRGAKAPYRIDEEFFQDSNKVNTTGLVVSDSINDLVGAAAAPAPAALSSVAILSRRQQAGAHDDSFGNAQFLDVSVFVTLPSRSWKCKSIYLRRKFLREFFAHSVGDAVFQ